MTLVRWNPAREIELIRHELDRAFGLTSDSTYQTQDSSSALQVWETADAYLARLVIPDAEADSFNIEAFPYGLAISGKVNYKAPEGAKLVYGNSSEGEFSRKFRVATQIETDNVVADYDSGILSVTLPKLKTSRVVKIAVNGAKDSIEN